MIIVDQDANAKLSIRLERIKAEAENARGIYLKQSGASKEGVISALHKHIASVDMQIFLCGDGDIFILAPTIASKHGREFILDVAAAVGKPASEEWVRFIELPLQIHSSLVEVQAKLDKQRKAEEAQRKAFEQQQAERKRQAILNGGSTARWEEIKHRRSTRTIPEIMVIEDDAFSRRLLENALEKKYKLTDLSEATYALATYARLAPDLLFLDINLPDVTGHELLEKIITLDPEAYVIMLSGNSDRENIMHAMNKGAKGFVAKPFTKDKLLQYIERCPTIHQ